MAQKWYSIEAKADDKPAEINIFDAIGNTWDGEGVTAKQFISDLKPLAGKPLALFINSPGGSVSDGLAIYNALKAHDGEITVKVMGVAASAASFIAMAGDKIVMPENTFLMVHNPLSWAYGNADEFREVADTLDKIGSSLIGIYVARTKQPEAEIKALLDAETWLTANEALALGFADEVLPEMKVAAAFNIDKMPANIKGAFMANKAPETPPPTKPPVVENVVPPVVESVALADEITRLVAAAGLDEHLPVFALAESVDAAKAHITEARNIVALCGVLKMTDKAGAFINAGTTYAEVRKTLIAARASTDEKTHTSNVQRQPNSPAPDTSQPAALKTADVWAARRKQLSN